MRAEDQAVVTAAATDIVGLAAGAHANLDSVSQCLTGGISDDHARRQIERARERLDAISAAAKGLL